jgi:DNA-binding transcriptional MerR regulator/methylmalonyl-CoA mutase cobalamin-binding subunit
VSYRIKTVASLTGLSPATLRAWERRYDLLSPQRSEGGYRLYTEQEVALLRHVGSLVENGYSPSEAAAAVKRMALETTVRPADTIEQIRREILQALLALDHAAAELASEPLASLAAESRLEDVLMPVLREIGERWACGEASVVQEHFASVFIRDKLLGLLNVLGNGPLGGREVVCAGTPGEAHELGLTAIAVHLALRGWRVVYLGIEVPIQDLRATLASRRPALLCTSLIQPVSGFECLQLARTLRSAAPPETQVIVGGAGVPDEVVGRHSDGLYLARTIAELFEILA